MRRNPCGVLASKVRSLWQRRGGGRQALQVFRQRGMSCRGAITTTSYPVRLRCWQTVAALSDKEPPARRSGAQPVRRVRARPSEVPEGFLELLAGLDGDGCSATTPASCPLAWPCAVPLEKLSATHGLCASPQHKSYQRYGCFAHERTATGRTAPALAGGPETCFRAPMCPGLNAAEHLGAFRRRPGDSWTPREGGTVIERRGRDQARRSTVPALRSRMNQVARPISTPTLWRRSSLLSSAMVRASKDLGLLPRRTDSSNRGNSTRPGDHRRGHVFGISEWVQAEGVFPPHAAASPRSARQLRHAHACGEGIRSVPTTSRIGAWPERPHIAPGDRGHSLAVVAMRRRPPRASSSIAGPCRSPGTGKLGTSGAAGIAVGYASGHQWQRGDFECAVSHDHGASRSSFDVRPSHGRVPVLPPRPHLRHRSELLSVFRASSGQLLPLRSHPLRAKEREQPRPGAHGTPDTARQGDGRREDPLDDTTVAPSRAWAWTSRRVVGPLDVVSLSSRAMRRRSRFVLSSAVACRSPELRLPAWPLRAFSLPLPANMLTRRRLDFERRPTLADQGQREACPGDGQYRSDETARAGWRVVSTPGSTILTGSTVRMKRCKVMISRRSAHAG